MLVVTQYSTYQVTALGEWFRVRKVSLDNIESVLMAEPGYRMTNYLHLQIGEPFRFADMVTSPVVSVMEE